MSLNLFIHFAVLWFAVKLATNSAKFQNSCIDVCKVQANAVYIRLSVRQFGRFFCFITKFIKIEQKSRIRSVLTYILLRAGTLNYYFI